jgi:hypothetical protein
MGLTVITTIGLIIWIVLWAIGAKSFDAFMITLLLVLVGGTAKLVAPHLPGRKRD